MARLPLIVGVCVILLTIEKGVICQDDDEGGQSCPKLAGSALRVVCEERGRTVDCSDARTGTIAKPVWKKNIVKQSKKGGVTGLKCSPSGQWKASGVGGVGGAGGGYEKIPNLGMVKPSLVGVPYEVAVAMCRQDGAKVFGLDSMDKLEWARQDYPSRQIAAVHSAQKDDIWTGVSNLEDRNVFKSTTGRQVDDLQIYNARGEKNTKERQCIVYNAKKHITWQVSCGDSRGFYCLIASGGEEGSRPTAEGGGE